MSETATPGKTAKSAGIKTDAPDFDPWDSPGEYLLSKGWKPQGDPRRHWTKWLDPTKPEKETYSKRLALTRVDPRTKKVEEIYQTVVTPAAWPLSRNEAVLIQIERDVAAQVKK